MVPIGAMLRFIAWMSLFPRRLFDGMSLIAGVWGNLYMLSAVLEV